jgi:hypothetical protein
VRTVAAFRSGAWLAMLESRDLPPFATASKSGELLPRAGTLAWIQRECAWQKTPRIVVLVKQIMLTETDAVIVARDPTGEMPGSVHVSAAPSCVVVRLTFSCVHSVSCWTSTRC